MGEFSKMPNPELQEQLKVFQGHLAAISLNMRMNNVGSPSEAERNYQKGIMSATKERAQNLVAIVE